MAVVQISRNDGDNIRTYQCLTTDLENTYPDNSDCDPMSKMIVVDATTHAVSVYKYFDGTNWNTL